MSTYQSFVIKKILFLFLFNYKRIAETILVIAGRVVSEANICCAVWAEVMNWNYIMFRAATK